VLAVTIVLLAIFVGRYWYAAASQGDPQLGVSFSCRQVRYLGNDCATVYAALLDDVGVKHVRLSLYWSDVEPAQGQFDFAETDQLVREASARGADVLLTIGIKAQRYPEVYLPAWLAQTSGLPQGTVLDGLPGVHDATLAFVEAAVRHYAADSAVIGWQIENEPYIKNFQTINGWVISPAMVAAEAETVRREDYRHRPVVVTHSSWTVYDQNWKRALQTGDVLGQNVFTKKAWIRNWWYFFPLEMGPFVPDLPGQARATKAKGKQFWITELQAEPEERRSLTDLDLGQVRSISPAILDWNVAIARRSGATRVYLWGAEWWYAIRGKNQRLDMWSAAKRLFQGR